MHSLKYLGFASFRKYDFAGFLPLSQALAHFRKYGFAAFRNISQGFTIYIFCKVTQIFHKVSQIYFCKVSQVRKSWFFAMGSSLMYAFPISTFSAHQSTLGFNTFGMMFLGILCSNFSWYLISIAVRQWYVSSLNRKPRSAFALRKQVLRDLNKIALHRPGSAMHGRGRAGPGRVMHGSCPANCSVNCCEWYLAAAACCPGLCHSLWVTACN